MNKRALSAPDMLKNYWTNTESTFCRRLTSIKVCHIIFIFLFYFAFFYLLGRLLDYRVIEIIENNIFGLQQRWKFQFISAIETL